MNQVALPQDTLLAIIAVQQEIVEADLALDRVLEVVTRTAARLTRADAAVVELLDGADMVYRAGSGAAADHVGLRLSAANSLSGLCVKLDQTLRCDDCETDERVDRDACRRVGARSMLVTPLRFRDAALGVLKVYSSHPAAFDDAAAEILRLLVGIVAASMQRARDHEGLTQRAHHDVLTGLANRQQLEAAMHARIRDQRAFALIFLDLNDFKRINDERGHASGDEVLQIVAGRVVSSLRGGDIAARFGGDEFVVLLEGVDSAAAAAGTLQRLLQQITIPIQHGEELLTVSASAGVAVFPSDAATGDALLRLADTRMYDGKKRKVLDV